MWATTSSLATPEGLAEPARKNVSKHEVRHVLSADKALEERLRGALCLVVPEEPQHVSRRYLAQLAAALPNDAAHLPAAAASSSPMSKWAASAYAFVGSWRLLRRKSKTTPTFAMAKIAKMAKPWE